MSLRELSEAVRHFRDERDWAQFHTLRNLIVSLNLEAGELLELTQWQSDVEIEALADATADAGKREALADECADVLLYLLLIADRAGIDLDAAARAKLKKNAAKYPVELSRGSRRKYTEIRAASAAKATDTTSAACSTSVAGAAHETTPACAQAGDVDRLDG